MLIFSRYLTKSRFKLATDCPTKLYYTGKPREYANTMQDNAFLEMLADGGYQVGALAKLRYPGGVEVTETDHQLAVAHTNALLEQVNVVIFEPAIMVGDFFIRIDILVKQGNRFELIEVKAKSYDSLSPDIEAKRGGVSSSFKPYLLDVAFQTWILKQAFPHADISSFLMMPDKAKAAPIDGVNQMFKISERGEIVNQIPNGVDTQSLATNMLAKVCVDQYVAILLTTPLEYPGGIGLINDVAPTWASAYQSDSKIRPSIGTHCKGCEFKASNESTLKSGFHECWKQALGWQDTDFEEGTVLDLWNFRKTQSLMDQGIIKLKQLHQEDIGDGVDIDTDGLSRTKRQWMQVAGIAPENDAGGFYFDADYFVVQHTKWVYPYHMIDFETASVALPYYADMRPYEAVAFQFSHHVMDADGSVCHAHQFLNTEPGVFPNYDFVRALKNAVVDVGTVFMWSHHENSILTNIRKQLLSESHPPADADDLIAFIATVTKGGNREMVDLCRIAEKVYYHPDTKGSVSIKKVLPSMITSSSLLQGRYSQPTYGTTNGIVSLNFDQPEGFTWLTKNEVGQWRDPYKTLKDYASAQLPADTLDDDVMISIIADGGAATTAYARLQFEQISDPTRGLINQALLRYCELDTLAMVMVMQGWQAFVDSSQ